MRGNEKNKHYVEKIRFYCGKALKILNDHQRDRDYFMHSEEMQYACSMCIVQIGEMTAMIDNEYKLRHPEIPWRLIKGARNVYVHDYAEVDLDEVWAVLTEDIPKLMEQMDELLTEMENPSLTEIVD